MRRATKLQKQSVIEAKIAVGLAKLAINNFHAGSDKASRDAAASAFKDARSRFNEAVAEYRQIADAEFTR
jgi:hypothetical protein